MLFWVSSLWEQQNYKRVSCQRLTKSSICHTPNVTKTLNLQWYRLMQIPYLYQLSNWELTVLLLVAHISWTNSISITWKVGNGFIKYRKVLLIWPCIGYRGPCIPKITDWWRYFKKWCDIESHVGVYDLQSGLLGTKIGLTLYIFVWEQTTKESSFCAVVRMWYALSAKLPMFCRINWCDGETYDICDGLQRL